LNKTPEPPFWDTVHPEDPLKSPLTNKLLACALDSGAKKPTIASDIVENLNKLPIKFRMIKTPILDKIVRLKSLNKSKDY
jgi:hypothetical protein